MKRQFWMSAVMCGALLTGCGGEESETVAPDSENPGSETPAPGVTGGKADSLFANGPLYVTGGFDGSKSFRMWQDTMRYARDFQEKYGKRLSFTYFINTCYYDSSVRGSWIGTAKSQPEIIARTGLSQQAINEGHEIANHAVRHQDGSGWSVDEWRKEIQEFHDFTDNNLFEPIFDEAGKAVFPKYEPVASGTATGAACGTDSDCDSGICLSVNPDLSLCSARCNKHNPCPDGMACGAPDWNRSTDRCMPLPKFPVEHNGQELFSAEGKPNLDHPDLKPYKVVGFRAPQLGHNKALFEILEEFDYMYDTSKILRPGPPQRTNHGGTVFESIYQYALMKNPGSRTVPMDYNYKFNDVPGSRMLSDYKRSIVDAYNARQRQPWNIGHHFALWRNGEYWAAMKGALEFAAEGCPKDDGTLQCEDVLFPSFLELSLLLDGKIEEEALRIGEADGTFEDPFLPAESREEENDVALECICGDDSH
ncbi:MAG: hypothetical protein ACE366_15590 [Bradymonadia bacterium]